MTTYTVAYNEDSRSHEVLGLKGWGDKDQMLIVRYKEGDCDTKMTSAKNMHSALYDLYQTHDGLKEGDRFETEFGAFVCYSFHVLREDEFEADILEAFGVVPRGVNPGVPAEERAAVTQSRTAHGRTIAQAEATVGHPAEPKPVDDLGSAPLPKLPKTKAHKHLWSPHPDRVKWGKHHACTVCGFCSPTALLHQAGLLGGPQHAAALREDEARERAAFAAADRKIGSVEP